MRYLCSIAFIGIDILGGISPRSTPLSRSNPNASLRRREKGNPKSKGGVPIQQPGAAAKCRFHLQGSSDERAGHKQPVAPRQDVPLFWCATPTNIRRPRPPWRTVPSCRSPAKKREREGVPCQPANGVDPPSWCCCGRGGPDIRPSHGSQAWGTDFDVRARSFPAQYSPTPETYAAPFLAISAANAAAGDMTA